MPATTRSATKQPKLEDLKGTTLETTSKSKSSKPNARSQDYKNTSSSPSKSRKRKAPPSDKPTSDADEAHHEQKKPRRAPSSTSSPGDDDRTITINRAPVLQLWSASVTHLLYPSLSWPTCLSIGSSIASITAISKGRSIGTIAKSSDPAEADKKRAERRALTADKQVDEVDVMGFHLSLDGQGNAMVSGKAKTGSEQVLKGKFGGEEGYEFARGVFEGELEGWRGREEELNHRAFGMYEDFRPGVPKGQKGWGRRGELRVGTVRDAVGGG